MARFFLPSEDWIRGLLVDAENADVMLPNILITNHILPTKVKITHFHDLEGVDRNSKLYNLKDYQILLPRTTRNGTREARFR